MTLIREFLLDYELDPTVVKYLSTIIMILFITILCIIANFITKKVIIRIITKNVKEKEERLLNLAYSSLRKRVAKALVDIREKFDTSGQNKPIEISREDIAHYVGTATESLIRTLSDFKAEKLIEIKEGKIQIANLDKLKNLLY